MNSKIKNICTKLEKKGLDGLIVSSPSNISYLIDYRSRDSYLVISKKGNVYITDSRYIREAKRNLNNNFTIKEIDNSVFKIIADVCCKLKLRRVGFEERHLPYGEYIKIKENLDKKINLVSTYSLVEQFRQTKNLQELKKIKKAVHITIMALRFIKNFILPGKREIEVAAELERFIRYNGAHASSFDIIVASGPNSSFPHHITSQRKIKDNESVLVDIGVDYQGFKSDLTRIFFLGKITPIVRRIYSIVLGAQERALRKIKPNVFINKIDRAARQYIARQGFGGFFGHNLGHSIGLEVHEDPPISSRENRKLKTGMVFTIEPAIYLPNKFGIRIEDMVLVTRKGCEVLSGDLDK